jgi:hypothetical protein
MYMLQIFSQYGLASLDSGRITRRVKSVAPVLGRTICIAVHFSILPLSFLCISMCVVSFDRLIDS